MIRFKQAPYHKGTHDQLIKDLEKRLLEGNVNYSRVDHNLIYSNRSGTLGEVDLWAWRLVNGERVDLFFEMKSNGSERLRNRAVKQLRRHSHYLGGDRFYLFFVSDEGIERVIE